jgi:hypothetical protein
MDVELLNLIKEIRDTCGIDPKDPEFNRHIAKTTFNYLMRRKEVNEYIKIGVEIFCQLAPQLSPTLNPIVSGVGSITLPPSASTSSLIAPAVALINTSNPNQLPPISDPPVDWFWSNLDTEEVDAV